MKLYTIRKEVFNADIKQWEKINNLCANTESMVVTPQQFYSYVGYCGALTAKCNEDEMEFFNIINGVEEMFNE